MSMLMFQKLHVIIENQKEIKEMLTKLVNGAEPKTNEDISNNSVPPTVSLDVKLSDDEPKQPKPKKLSGNSGSKRLRKDTGNKNR